MKTLVACGIAALVLSGTSAAAQTIQFGDDSSQWANDGECDDGRFTGSGMTTTPLLEDDVMADASDCYAAYQAGRLQLRGVSGSMVDFGNDSSEWANDRECDDMRFEGPGMTTTPLLEQDIMADASDCKAFYDAGQLWLRGVSR